MAERLAAADRSSLLAERGPVNMTVGGVVLCEKGPGVEYDAICKRISERIHLLPRYRQRLLTPTMGLANPVWVDDEHFDVHWHVRLAKLPDPGGYEQLAAFVGREYSRKMDRSRPLWELHLIEGLPDNQVAIVLKLHHALVDGLAAIGIGMVLLDLTPEPPAIDPPAREWRPRPYAMRRHLARLAATPVTRTQRLMIDGTMKLLDTSPRSAAGDLRRASEVLLSIVRTRSSAPKLPINRPISPNRSWAFASTSLSAVKAAGKATGGTINDVILASVSGALAIYLSEARVNVARLDRDPVALVPVSVRAEGDTASGNRISIVFVDLPVSEPDPAKRVKLINERMTRIKGSARVRAGAIMVDATGFAPPVVFSALTSALAVAPGTGSSPFNLAVSNVPGPQAPLYFNGCRVLGMYPVVPLNPGDQALNVGVLSYDGKIFFGVSTDRALDPPAARMTAALEHAIAELVALGDQ